MATLKISDLSVGDWVEYEGLHYPITFVGYGEGGDGSLVNLIRPDLSCFTCKISDISPIPITAEILEKNGFKDVSGGLFRYEREWRDDKIAVMLCSFDEELWFVDFDFRGGRCVHTNIPIFYINQLQHILRLAGVDKEINL